MSNYFNIVGFIEFNGFISNNDHNTELKLNLSLKLTVTIPQNLTIKCVITHITCTNEYWKSNQTVTTQENKKKARKDTQN